MIKPICKLTATGAAQGLAIILGLSGCAVGPNFKRPAAPAATNYVDSPLKSTPSATNVAGGESQRFVEGLNIPGQWWALFHSEPLNELIQRSLTNNPDLKAAQEALVVAQENLRAQRGVYYPNLSGSFSGSRQHQSDFLSPAPNANIFEYNLFTPQVSVSYSPDVFGLNRRTVELSKAQEQASRCQMIATYLTLSANVVVAAIQEASLRAQIETTRQLVGISSNVIDIVQYQYSKGYASGLDVAAQQSQLAQITATLPPLIKQLAQQHDLLAVLAGDFPGGQKAIAFDLSKLALPEDLPVSVPARLVEQRPDILQAEENLHAASAQIGIATANRLPDITLTANAGSTALSLDKLFASGSGFWAVGGTLTQPIFDGGTLLHQQRAAKAAYRQAAQQYRSTVLSACQNVADTLNALEQDAAALQTAAAADAAAKVTLDLSREQWKSGYGGYLALLNAEQTYQQAQINLVQAQANRFSDTAALFQALGGGWWNQPELKEKQ
ncbi:MAG TPA: efflux transporter outer membrane subunit [Verrucomicrobiae bacterium]|jgi:NodT family efflux transporter outer membrane factor (OMF) lipoprotein